MLQSAGVVAWSWELRSVCFPTGHEKTTCCQNLNHRRRGLRATFLRLPLADYSRMARKGISLQLQQCAI